MLFSLGSHDIEIENPTGIAKRLTFSKASHRFSAFRVLKCKRGFAWSQRFYSVKHIKCRTCSEISNSNPGKGSIGFEDNRETNEAVRRQREASGVFRETPQNPVSNKRSKID